MAFGAPAVRRHSFGDREVASPRSTMTRRAFGTPCSSPPDGVITPPCGEPPGPGPSGGHEQRPGLAATRLTFVFQLGQAVRYLSPRGAAIQAALPLGLLLFPRYRPDQSAATQPPTPKAALYELVAAEAVIRGLDQDKLDALARWVSAVPAYTLTYPDLASGLAAVEALVKRTGAPAQDRLLWP